MRMPAAMSAVILLGLCGVCAAVGTAWAVVALNSHVRGTVTIDRCVVVETARPSDPYDCFGRFVSDDGTIASGVSIRQTYRRPADTTVRGMVAGADDTEAATVSYLRPILGATTVAVALVIFGVLLWRRRPVGRRAI